MRVILVERRSPNERSRVDEFKELCEVAGYEVAEIITQVREQDPAYQIGRGKAEFLAERVRKVNAHKVVFINNLKPIQEYNLAKLTGVEVIDGFRLILEVFARRARTREAKLQIKLARLKYELPRAKEKVKLAKLGEQPGFHGLGKYNVDIYYDMLRRQMLHLQRKLNEIRQRKKHQREIRREHGFPTISLAGYTCAGKSTLFNLLTRESVPVGEGMFTTLSTVTRLANFYGRKALVVDTVGFIDGLPIDLIESFKATLEETIYADLILLVVDVHEPLKDIRRKIDCCLDILGKIEATKQPIILALNKIDLLSESELQDKLDRLGDYPYDKVPISALYEINIGELMRKIFNHLGKYRRAEIVLPLTSSSVSFASKLRNYVNIIDEQYTNDKLLMRIEALEDFVYKLHGQISELGGTYKFLP